MAEASRWLDRDHAASHICVRPDDLRRMVKDGRIPPPSYHLGVRRPRWDRYALDAAMTGSLVSAGSTNADLAIEALRNDLLRRPRRQKAAC